MQTHLQPENTGTYGELETAAKRLYEWAKREIIVEECREHRVPGCLSCDTIAFFECVADELNLDELRK